MTEKELRKLKRSDLLEIMYYLQKEIETLQTENESLRQQLENAEGGISSENLEKIINAVKAAAEECFRGQSENKSVGDVKSDNESERIKSDEPRRAGKREDG